MQLKKILGTGLYFSVKRGFINPLYIIWVFSQQYMHCLFEKILLCKSQTAKIDALDNWETTN